jgi:hypothetical protein
VSDQLAGGTPRSDAAVAAAVRRHTRLASLPWWRGIVIWWACAAFVATPVVGAVLTVLGQDKPGAPLFRWAAAAGVVIVAAGFAVAVRRLRFRIAELARHGELVAASVAYVAPIATEHRPSPRASAVDIRIVVVADPHRQYMLINRDRRGLRPPAWATVGRAVRLLVSDHESYGILQIDEADELLVQHAHFKLGAFARPRALMPLPSARLRKRDR